MKMNSTRLLVTAGVLSGSIVCEAKTPRYNVIVMYADDISARELPAYHSSVWSPPRSFGNKSSDPQYRAQTPVLDRLAKEGALIRTAWANAVCSPSRATLMTGRYAHLHKWWQNNDIGDYINEQGHRRDWPLYKSSPNMIGQVAKAGGYDAYWVGKTQMNKEECDIAEFGFDAVVTSPGGDIGLDYDGFTLSDFIFFNPAARGRWYTDTPKQVPFVSDDTGKSMPAVWSNASFYWQPFIATWNVPQGCREMRWWPQDKKEREKFGLNTYGPDVEMDFSLKFIEQSHREGRPFFLYHTPHLGHSAYDHLGQTEGEGRRMIYVGTPKVQWDGQRYTRTEVNITGDKGIYDTHGTVTERGIHNQISYLDYQVWQYMQKLEALGIKEETIFIFAADNGTTDYGKMEIIKQRGPHVPFYIYIPGMTKTGTQDILVDVTDILATLADAVGFEFPADYEVNGKSLLPYFKGESDVHRDWIYSFLFEKQLIRGHKVLRDGNGDWWDVSREPDDLDSYPKITDWNAVSPELRNERDLLLQVLPRFDTHASEHDAPALNSGLPDNVE